MVSSVKSTFVGKFGVIILCYKNQRQILPTECNQLHSVPSFSESSIEKVILHAKYSIPCFYSRLWFVESNVCFCLHYIQTYSECVLPILELVHNSSYPHRFSGHEINRFREVDVVYTKKDCHLEFFYKGNFRGTLLLQIIVEK